jgi:hypothetical protein
MFLKNIRLCGAIALLSVAATPFAASADEALMGSFFWGAFADQLRADLLQKGQ